MISNFVFMHILLSAPVLFLRRPSFFLAAGIFFILAGCGRETAPQPTTNSEAGIALKEALTFYASFDEGFVADFAKGDPQLYTAPAWDAASEATPVSGDEGLVTRLTEGGRIGGALRFNTDWNPVVFFRGEDNVAYADADWEGSFSFWLRVDPVHGLAEGYSDPFLISDKNWDNASFYVDFTETRPRHFRYAAFSDYDVWNPAGVPWEMYPVEDRPMIDLAALPFNANSWTHVVLTFESVNAAGKTGRVTGYLDGEYLGTLELENLTISWAPADVLMAIGRHYAGDFDDLAVFNRALLPEEVSALHTTALIDLF